MRRQVRKISHLTNHFDTGQIKPALFIFIAAFSIGLFTYLFMEASEKNNLSEYIRAVFSNNGSVGNFIGKTWLCMRLNLIMLAGAFATGLTRHGRFLGVIPLFWKGATLGFSATLLISTMGIKGAGAVAVSLLPQNLIVIPVMMMAFIFSWENGLTNGISFINRHKNTGSKNMNRYCMRFFILALALLVASVVEVIFPQVSL